MHTHIIMHVPFEGPGRIADWAQQRGHALTTQLALTEEYPDPAHVGLVCVMGGPMDADDHLASAWLGPEKAWLTRIVECGIPVLGVCLGAQILAEVLGGSVKRNPEREIGWFPVRRTPAAATSRFFPAWPDDVVLGHWHGDTFTLPAGVDATLSSEACRNQAFESGSVVGLQFHLEWEDDGLRDLAARCADELSAGGRYVQRSDDILAEAPLRIAECERLLFGLLDDMTRAT